MASTREMAFYALLGILGYLSYLVLKPFLGYVILAFLFAFLFHPLHLALSKVLWEGLSATIVLVVVLICIVVPSVYLAGTLVAQASDAYQLVEGSGISLLDETSISNGIERWTGMAVHEEVVELFDQGRVVVKAAIPGLITSTGVFLIGLFIFFFVLYFALRDGGKWFLQGVAALPIKKNQKAAVAEKLTKQTRALLYGQILTSILVGIIVGVFLWYFGIPNAVFWAFLTIILGIIPVIGAFVVYIPAGIYLLAQGQWFNGIALMVLSTACHLVIDNILRPKLVSKASEIHPAIVILGALGGIALMGVVGFLVGPLILSFFIILLKFDSDVST